MRGRGGRLVARTLKAFDVPRLFSLPGHQILSVYDACLDESLPLISTRHEASAVYMAEATSFATRAPGVALLAGGPELTNALTGIAKAYYAGTPLLVIAGTNTLAKLDRGFPQDMDQLALVRPFTKWARGCYEITRIPEYIATAYRHAICGRPGPAYVEIPYNLLESRVDLDAVPMPGRPRAVRPVGDDTSLQAAADLLGMAERPLIIAGSGALWSEAEADLQAFVERVEIPLFLTNAAIAMPFPTDLVAGYGSPGSGRPALHTIAEADVILLLGTRVGFMLGFGQEPFLSPRHRIIQIDIEAGEIGRNRPVDVALVGDLRMTLRRLTGLMHRPAGTAAWRARVKQLRDEFNDELEPQRGSEQVPVHPMRVASDLEAGRPAGASLVLDGANSILWALLAVRPRPESQILISPLGDLEAIGAGIPHAIGLKLARPQQPVFLHTGDGSFGYGAMEFETAVRYGIPFVAVVHNDGGWGMTRDMQQEFFGEKREIGNTLGVVRYDRMVEGLGGYGECVQRPDALGPALRRALDSGKPACVNVTVDPGPKSPGLRMFMLLETMLGRPTAYDRIPSVMERLGSLGLGRTASRMMRHVLDRKLHRDMR